MELRYERLFRESRERYTVFIKNVFEVKEVEEVEEVELKGKHFPTYGKRNVKAAVITNSVIGRIANIGYIGINFVNLTALEITDCNIKQICNDDFLLFHNLEELILTNNLVVSIPADLFDHTPRLKHLSFRNNKIQFISQHTLTPLTLLEYADFRGNVTIDEIYDKTGESPKGITLCKLRTKIFLQCKPSTEKVSTVASYVEILWRGLLSDFKIKANDEVFEVHKAVLSANSPVFAAMFSHEMEENVKNEMTIENYFPESVKELLAFVYLREVPKKCFKPTNLYAMAEEYQIKELSEQIQWQITLDVSGENASELFKFGVLYNNQLIKQAAFQEIEQSLNRKLPQELIESVDVMVELLEVKDKLDEVLKRIDRMGISSSF